MLQAKTILQHVISDTCHIFLSAYRYNHTYIILRTFHNLHTFIYALCQRYSLLHTHRYTILRTLPTNHTLTHTLCHGYPLLYIYSHKHYAKNTHNSSTCCADHLTDFIWEDIPYPKTAGLNVHSPDLSKLSDLLCMGVCFVRQQCKLNIHTYIIPRILPTI